MTKRFRKRDSSVMMSSVIPSEKYSCAGSSDMLVNGSTAIDGLEVLTGLRVSASSTVAIPA